MRLGRQHVLVCIEVHTLQDVSVRFLLEKGRKKQTD